MDVEIVFDDVNGAGTFVEFEFTGDADTVEEATARLEAFIDSLDVGTGRAGQHTIGHDPALLAILRR